MDIMSIKTKWGRKLLATLLNTAIGKQLGMKTTRIEINDVEIKSNDESGKIEVRLDVCANLEREELTRMIFKSLYGETE